MSLGRPIRVAPAAGGGQFGRLLLALPIRPIVSLWSQRGVNLGLLLGVPFRPILYHLASVAGYRFDILWFLRQTRGDGGGMLGGFSLAGWCRCWEGASVSKGFRWSWGKGEVRTLALANGPDGEGILDSSLCWELPVKGGGENKFVGTIGA